MKVTIIGAGAIGGLAGAWMAMAGEDVTLVDRWTEHVDAINANGLHIDGLRGEHHVQLPASSVEDLAGPLGMVFLACKSQDTVEAVNGFRDKLGEDDVVVSLQNGMNEWIIGEMIGLDRVLGAIPDYGGALVDPGHIEFVHPGPSYVGELDGSITPRAQEAQRLLALLSETELTTDIVARLWAKQVHMSQVVMTALVDAPIAQVLQVEAAQHVGISIIAESIAITDAAGIALPEGKTIQTARYRSRKPEDARALMSDLSVWAKEMNQHQIEHEAAGEHKYVKQASGMWWDIFYRNRPSETRWITGTLLEAANEFGVAAPLNQRTAEMIYELESGQRSAGIANIEELYAFAKAEGLLLPN